MKTFLALFLCVLALSAFGQDLIDNPESIVYDYEHDRYLVSCWGNSKIVAIDDEGNQTAFLEDLGQILGIHLRRDRLYISSGNRLKSYSLENGELIMNLYISCVNGLDGITSDDSGYIYVLDTIGRLHRVDPETETSEMVVSEGLPDLVQDLVFDRANHRLVIASWALNAPITTYDLETQAVETAVETIGRFDGINIDYEGNFYLGCPRNQSVMKWGNDLTGEPETVATGLEAPAGLCYNARANELAIPNFDGSFLTFVSLGDPFQFETHILEASLNNADNLCLADIDDDGYQDIVACGTDQVHYWLGDGAGGFSPGILPGNYPGICRIRSVDMDDDQDKDILYGCMESGKVGWIEIGEFLTEHVIDDDLTYVRSLDAGDFDQDDDVDVICGVGDTTEGGIFLYENSGAMNFEDPVHLPDDVDSYQAVRFFDKDGDFDLDVVAGGYNDDGIGWWENLGDEGYTRRGLDSSFDGASCVDTADMNHDDVPDVIAASWMDNRVKMWRQSNGNFFQTPISSDVPGARWIEAVDFDYDGEPDVIGCGDDPGTIYWWQKSTVLDFTSHTFDLPGARCVTAHDFNGDSFMDIAVVTGSELFWLEGIAPTSPVRADFDVYRIYGTRLRTYRFVDRSGGCDLTWAWDLDGDGSVDSDEQYPYFTYESFGEYTVSLTVSSGDESHTLTIPDFIVYDQAAVDEEVVQPIQTHFEAIPNPFNPTTIIHYSLPEKRTVTFTMYDVRGRKVEQLQTRGQKGSNTVTWNADGQSSGVYFIRLETDDAIETRKVLLLK